MDEDVQRQASAEAAAPAENLAPVRNIVSYFREVIPLLLGGTEGELSHLLSSDESQRTLGRFIDDSQCAVLTIGRYVKDKEEGEDQAADEEQQPIFMMSVEVGSMSTKYTCVAFVKRGAHLVADKELSTQLRVLTLSDGQPFETLHSYVHNAIKPYLSAAVSAQKSGDKIGIKSVTRAIADLELSLLHLQDDIEIPEISLPIHPVVKQLIQKAAEQGRKPAVQDLGDKVEDPQLLNALQKCVSKWIREMQKVTKLDRDPSSGTTMQEVSFWLNLEQALYAIRDRRDSMDVWLTLEILKHGKRFHATVSFDSDTGLAKAMETVTNYNQLMKDFPLSGLLSAADTEAIRIAIIDIFAHMKKMRSTRYPVTRATKLIQTLSRDLSDQLLRVLSGQGLMQVSYAEFERITTGCKKVFSTWDEEEERFRGTLRDQIKKQREDASTKTFRRGAPDHKNLHDRIDEIINFRKAHEQLRTVIVRVLRPSAVHGAGAADTVVDAADLNAIEEVNLAYEDVKSVDVLDLSPAGTQTWEMAKRRYEERIDRVENRIASRLRDQLGTAKNGSEMFRIFGKFNALFVRPHIRGAIKEYQANLIQRVKADIESLQQKFKVQYAQTQNAWMSEVRDLPPISGQIIWAKQIERQLMMYLRRVEDVLGRGWEAHVEGRALKEEGEAFKAKLDTTALFEKWASDANARPMTVTGRIFDIDVARTSSQTRFVLGVNFHSQIITLSKEVRNLKWLGFRVPLTVVNKALQAHHSYPYAISLRASVRTYQQTLDKLMTQPNLASLVANYHKQIQTRIAEGVTLRWESYRLETFVQSLAEEVNSFQEKVDEVLQSGEKVDSAVAMLDTIPFNREAFQGVIERLQKIVDDLNLHSFVNLDNWVQRLDKVVEGKLAKRLSHGLAKWAQALENYGKTSSEWESEDVTTAGGAEGDGLPVIKPMVHEIQIRNQVMYLNPPAEKAREDLFHQLQEYLGVVTNISRIQSSRFQVGMVAPADQFRSQISYRSVLSVIPPSELLKIYRVIDDCYAAVQKYVQVWLQYQALWDMQTDTILSRLGDNLQKWTELLVEIKKARRTFDTSETSKSFGPVEINYAQVQTRVNMKYDALHKDILSQFGAKLGGVMNEFYMAVQKARTDLESQTLDTATTTDAVNFMSLLQEYQRRSKKWTEDMTTFGNGQRLLERQRYSFPADWLYLDNLQGQWDAFLDILNRKNALVQGQVSSLQLRIVEEDRVMDRRIIELLADWDRNKPVAGELKPDQAVQTIVVFETRFTRLKEEYEALAKAKHALDLDVKSDDRLAVRLEELQDLKSSWSELARIWSLIDELRAMQWSQVQPKKLRSSLEDLINQLKNLPPRVRTYAAYEHTVTTVKDYMKANPQVVSLKSDSLKERHWKQLMRDLGVSWTLSELTLGQVWKADLAKNHKLVEDAMLVAQGENALEEFLKLVREEWTAYQLELVNYQNKTRLIKGWDDLFNKVKEHMNSLNAMKLSHYYKVFEEEANAWDDKLNRINALFDVWIDVQRKWVYLEGIFSGSADIRHLLPTESSRFESISSEFMKLMSTVAGSKGGMVMEVIQIPGAQRSLERLADLLAKIQKALGEYLEKERSSFPRFYFVGNEDLLDIIGNSKNVERLQKHFQNMFAGVHSVMLNADHSEVVGLCSREAEEVHLKSPVKIKDVKINTWLTKLEEEMKLTLAKLLAEAVTELEQFRQQSFNLASYFAWLDRYQAQLVVLSSQVFWSHSVEGALKTVESNGGKDFSSLKAVLDQIDATLTGLADAVLLHQPAIRRRKLEHMITEMVHQRDVTRELFSNKVSSPNDFRWLSVMRFTFNPREPDVLKQLAIEMADAKFYYGFEYLGLIDKLVQTPLTDRCYLTMTQALKARQGGSPFGPAGTGKTESVKSLGNQLGRFVLVFNCDETFDFHAMSRIFVGLCQVGAWGCFDEFNRLEERQLSAVSQQIQAIQMALKENIGREGQCTAEILGRAVGINPDMAIFITMNPGYAGRSNLPDNLKKLFRNLAMTHPDRQLIAQVMLYSQGFRTAEKLASKVVPLFILCDEQLSAQSHYDFGLRALKAVLVTAGNVKRSALTQARDAVIASGQELNEEKVSASIDEQLVLIQSIAQTMIPKLVADDIPLLRSLLSDVFPGVEYVPRPMDNLRKTLEAVCAEQHLVASDNFITKMLQLFQVTEINHGLMLVGPSGSGKSTAWKVLLEALHRIEDNEGQAHVIDPKAISKDELYGNLDSTTREWTDGLLTHCVRKIIDNVRGELTRRQWIIFDGDVDPEWVENLNSVLDDNKLLTLPNGERLALPKNIRIIFEVQDLKNATLATVSRCGMVWFSDDVLTLDMHFKTFLDQLKNNPLAGTEGESRATSENSVSPAMAVQKQAASFLSQELSLDGLVGRCLEFVKTQEHIMTFTVMRALTSLFAMVRKSVHSIISYNSSHNEFPLSPDQVEQFIMRKLLYTVIWCFAGDSKYAARRELAKFIRRSTTIALPADPESDIIDHFVSLPEAQWVPWKSKVPPMELDVHRIAGTDVVVPTIDTVRHEDLLYSWLSEHLPMVLCGPPGSGKTMTLFSALRALPDFEVAGLNFSSATTPALILKTFEQWCEYRRTPNGLVLAPTQMNKWLIVFCDEINLPATDKYNTVRVITFMRQLVEQGGFWRSQDHSWVKLDRIQFVGACNPPTDPGRVPLDLRFLRHVPVIYVDYPGPESLKMIYGTFNRALMRTQPSLRQYGEPLTDAMVDFFTRTAQHFTQDMQPHYVYSPREMTRWVKGISEAISPLENLDANGLVRIWAHEALRLFSDRLVYPAERVWTDENVAEVARMHFPSVNIGLALQQPILFSNWLTKEYVSVDREQLREFTKARLKVFYEEELDVPLVLFDEVLDHVLRIDRIFRQNQGHLLLIGASGAGKTTLSRFVAWMNGLSVYQVKAHKSYTAADFDEDLRNVLRRSGTKAEKIVFIMDESNVMDTAFLERMNTLLANGEVPGLFEGDEYSALMTACKEGSQREGLVLDGNDELYKWFSKQVMNNLHVVFTMNPSEAGLHDRAATSPALFNRCVLDWFGDWSENALFQVGTEFTNKLDLDVNSYRPPQQFPVAFDRLPLPPSHRQAVINGAVFIHKTVQQAARRMLKREGRSTHVTPRHFLEFVNQFVHISNEKRGKLEDQQLHLNVGLKKLRDTVEQVEHLQHSLAEKSAQLEAKNEAANRKLKQMVQDQQAAEEKRASSMALEKELQVKQQAAEEKRNLVLNDLAQVEPALAEAKQAVEGVRKRDLQELRALANPPAVVKLALESVLCLLGEPTNVWNNIRSAIVQDDFLKKVLDFNPEAVSGKVREQMEQYLNNPDYTFDRADRASKAAGPLVKWAIASTSYASMLLSIEPLRNELKRLETDAFSMKDQVARTQALIAELETSIAKYKEEYAVLVSEAQAIKTDLSSVSAKVERSTKLLTSLDSERDRWANGSKEFDAQMSTIVGDCLLASAFLAYSGYFDQSYRHALFKKWAAHLKQAAIAFKHDLSFTEFLSTPDERLVWKQNLLPDDSLCTENAIMAKRRIRYPLIIDPSGQATEFIRRQMADQKLISTSFLDSAFRKNLESALRFGTPLLVQDAESYDPLLNPVLNREVRRAGGRVLISVGDSDIDLSPTFNIILTTRNPAVPFPPDICSRVNLINFTVTRSSLQTQCLNQVLRSERPDVDKKRSDLLKLQGEFRFRLRQLEQELLQSLNEARGSILDDDAIITKLENLKREASEISQKVLEADSVMTEIETTSRQYSPLAHKCSAIFFCLEQMHQVHYLYRYSLQFFLDIFTTALSANPKLEGVRDYSERLAIITRYLFQVTFERCASGLLNHHRVAFALTLVRFYLEGTPDELPADTLGFFMRGSSALATGKSDFAFLVPKILTEEQSAAAHALAHEVPAFADLAVDIRGSPDFATWMASAQPEDDVLPLGGVAHAGPSKVAKAFAELLLIQALRPDRLLARAQKFIDVALPDMIRSMREATGGLGSAVEKEIDAKTPILLCGESGYDPSGHVRDLYLASNHQCTEIALGAEEAFEEADKAITNAAKSGRWVLLKNAHLAINWLVKMEKRMLALTPHPQFRLFLTALIHPKLPVSLLCHSRVFVYEPAVGIKASLLTTLHRFPESMFAVDPAERGRVYFLLAWLHAVTQERLRYAPLGWSKKYEFGESDLRTASDTLGSWITSVAQGRAHVAPEKIPWQALRTLLSETIYGGRIDNAIDQRLLASFVATIFTERSFNSDFALVPADPASGTPAVVAPEGSRRDQFMEWVAALPDSQPPTWLGLPANAETVLLTTLAKNLAADMLRLQSIDDDADDSLDAADPVAGAAPLWMRTLQQQCTQWLSALPSQLQGLRRTAENIKDPMFRFFEREVNIGVRLLRQVRADLTDVGGACAGTVKQTNAIRALMTDLVKGVVPKSWRAYKVPDAITANQWIADFGLRIDQLLQFTRTASEGHDLRSARVWLGGLFVPEAFVTATRQAVAQAHSWSLEKLQLELDVRRDASDVPPPDKRSFLITGLRIDGASCAGDVLSLSSMPFTTQPLTILRWSLGNDTPRTDFVQLPVYLNATRANLVFMVSLRPSAGLTQDVFYKRGIALLCSNLSGLVR